MLIMFVSPVDMHFKVYYSGYELIERPALKTLLAIPLPGDGKEEGEVGQDRKPA